MGPKNHLALSKFSLYKFRYIPVSLLSINGRLAEPANHIIMPPPGQFVEEDLYFHRRWQRFQYLANQFWQRWIRSQRDMKIDDIYLMVDDNLPRNKYPLAPLWRFLLGSPPTRDQYTNWYCS